MATSTEEQHNGPPSERHDEEQHNGHPSERHDVEQHNGHPSERHDEEQHSSPPEEETVFVLNLVPVSPTLHSASFSAATDTAIPPPDTAVTPRERNIPPQETTVLPQEKNVPQIKKKRQCKFCFAWYVLFYKLFDKYMSSLRQSSTTALQKKRLFSFLILFWSLPYSIPFLSLLLPLPLTQLCLLWTQPCLLQVVLRGIEGLRVKRGHKLRGKERVSFVLHGISGKLVLLII